jgi:hypothetical protein
MSETITPENPCPFCGKRNDRASVVGFEGPAVAGDVSICIGCGGIALFNEDLTSRKPSDAELFGLAMSPDWPKVEATRHAIMVAIHRPRDGG